MPVASGLGKKYSFYQPEPAYDLKIVTDVGDRTASVIIKDARILFICIYQYNAESAGKELTLSVEIDGVVWLGVATIDDSTDYYAHKIIDMDDFSALLNLTKTIVNAGLYTDIRGQDVEIYAEFTDAAVGTDQIISLGVIYETLEET